MIKTIQLIGIVLPWVLAITFCLLVVLLGREIRKQVKPKRRRKPISHRLHNDPFDFPAVSLHTKRQLLAMCGGDIKLAARLAGTTQIGWEKAIWQLERDRR